MLESWKRTVLLLAWGILHVEKAGEYRKLYKLLSVMKTFVITSEVVTSRGLIVNPTQEQLTNMTIQSVIRSVSFSIGCILSI
jgi:hypothetical protein